jgi:type IV pilus assembly protein PilX
MTAIHKQPNLYVTTSVRMVGGFSYPQVRPSGRNGRQRGAVLIVGLIILVVLTLLGVQALRGNLAQERMSNNVRERNAAFQAAEAALRVGEVTGPFPSASAPLTDPQNWVLPNPLSPGDPTSNVTGVVTGFDAGLAQQPVYNVGPPQYIRIGLSLPPEWRLIYPVSSRGVGAQEGSVVVLQSGFEPPN